MTDEAKGNTTVKTAYLHIIDEKALAALLPMKRVGTWKGELAEAAIPDNVRTTLADGCTIVQAKGSAAGYAVLEGLRAAKAFEEGEFIPGTECLPITAFHPRMYGGVIAKLAEVLAKYDRVIARVFVNGKPGRPLTNVGNFPVQCYDQMSWVAPGSVGDEWIVWEIDHPKDEQEVGERPPARKRHAPTKRKTRRAKAKKEATE